MLEFLSPKREIILEFDSSNQNGQQGGLNDLLTSFICSMSVSTVAASGDSLSLLAQILFLYKILN